MRIKKCRPEIALPGGVVRLEFDRLESLSDLQVCVGDVEAEILGASTGFVTIKVPEAPRGTVSVGCAGGEAKAKLRLGRTIADELHPVGNPVVDLSGNVYVTYSGSRGESVPFGVFVVSPEGDKEPFLGDITNPTGLAIGPDNMLYVSSRHTGTVFRSSFDKQVEKFVDSLGIATGLVFDSKGNLYVGDRSGFIYRVSPEKETSVLCELEPSVSAYHLTIDLDDQLYATGPTLATQDCIYRISPAGDVHLFFKGFGRPQGLTFNSEGHLQVVGSYGGRKGLYSFKNGKSPELLVTAPMLVGLAYDGTRGTLYLANGNALFRVDL